MSNDIVRIGVLGSGFIGRIHLDFFGQVEGVELAGLFDVATDLAQKTAQEYGVAKVYESAEALIESPEIDAVVVGAPNKLHKPLAVQALQANKHVLLEKPMALNGVEAREIYQASQQNGGILMMAHQMRWDWLNREVKTLINSGAFGKIYNAKAGWWRRKGIPGWGSWFTRMDEAGGGPLIDIGVHLLDLGLYMMGAPKPLTVYGSTYAEFGPERRGLGSWGTPDWDGYFNVEDLATALIKLDNGGTLSLEVSWAVHTEQEGIFLNLMGTEGGVSIYDDNTAILSGQKFDCPFTVELTPPDNAEPARLALSKHFIECIREKKSPIADALSGLANHLIIDAIYASAKSGNSVKLDWDAI